GHHVDGALHEGVEGLPAALEIGNDDVEAVVAEMAAPFGQGQRQIIKVRLVGDAEPHRSDFRRLRADRAPQRRRYGNAGNSRGERSSAKLHDAPGGIMSPIRSRRINPRAASPNPRAACASNGVTRIPEMPLSALRSLGSMFSVNSLGRVANSE